MSVLGYVAVYEQGGNLHMRRHFRDRDRDRDS